MFLMILPEALADNGPIPRGRWASLTSIGNAVYRAAMQPVTTIEGRAFPFGRNNVDTDVIIPAKWLKTITRAGLAKGAFETVRAEVGNVFDDPAYAGASILIAGDNFGCGSSR